MSDDTDAVELVRGALLAQNRGDDDAFLAALDPEVDWEAGPNPFGLPERMHGRETVLRAARYERDPAAGQLLFTLYEIRAQGNDVLVLGGLSDTRGLSMPRAWIWTLREGRAVRVRAFGSHHAALRTWDERVTG